MLIYTNNLHNSVLRRYHLQIKQENMQCTKQTKKQVTTYDRLTKLFEDNGAKHEGLLNHLGSSSHLPPS